jgi:hypothetical protein
VVVAPSAIIEHGPYGAPPDSFSGTASYMSPIAKDAGIRGRTQLEALYDTPVQLIADAEASTALYPGVNAAGD